jgi:hypothetical protein
MDTISTYPDSRHGVVALAAPAEAPKRVQLVQIIDGKEYRTWELSPDAADALGRDLQREAAKCR